MSSPVSADQEPTQRIWKCGCGKIQLKLMGDPTIAPTNCHCHSCVAFGRYLDEKYNANNNKEYTSGIVHENNNGGSCATFFLPNQVEEITELTADQFGIIRIGPKGKEVRKYCKCCGTPLGVIDRSFWALNRNAIYETEDDQSGGTTKKYVPADPPPLNGNKKYAFDPSKVPEPNHNMAPLTVLLKFVKILLNPFGPTTDKDLLERVKNTEDTVVEEVPITWE